jgi:DNA mismatch endonuclease (patch repair protein)
MARIKGKNTKPETALRRLLTAMGYRYRLHLRDLPGRPDVVFTARRAVVFVHGCFWHAHSCPAGRIPKTRPEFWRAKLEANTARDARQLAELERAGWRTLVLWECEMKDLEAVGRRVADFLGSPKWPVRGR